MSEGQKENVSHPLLEEYRRYVETNQLPTSLRIAYMLFVHVVDCHSSPQGVLVNDIHYRTYSIKDCLPAT